MGLFGNNDRLNTARYNLEQYEKTKPADYQSKYQGQIKDVMDKLENMGDFDYDPDADAAYQQYKNQYTRQAKLANQNAQANAAAMTGGYGSSYGTQAGQNAYASTMNSLDNVLDSLYSQSKAQQHGEERPAAAAERAAERGKAGLQPVPERPCQLDRGPTVQKERVRQRLQRKAERVAEFYERGAAGGRHCSEDPAAVLYLRKGEKNGNHQEIERRAAAPAGRGKRHAGGLR